MVLGIGALGVVFWGHPWPMPLASLGWVVLLVGGLRWALVAGRDGPWTAVLLGQGVWSACILSFASAPPQIMPFFLSITIIMLFLPPKRGLVIAALVLVAALGSIRVLELGPSPTPSSLTNLLPHSLEFRRFFLLLPGSAAVLFGTLIRHSLLSSFIVEDLATELTCTNRELTEAPQARRRARGDSRAHPHCA